MVALSSQEDFVIQEIDHRGVRQFMRDHRRLAGLPRTEEQTALLCGDLFQIEDTGNVRRSHEDKYDKCQ